MYCKYETVNIKYEYIENRWTMTTRDCRPVLSSEMATHADSPEELTCRSLCDFHFEEKRREVLKARKNRRGKYVRVVVRGTDV
jgi:hypothetical protein